MGVPSVGQPSNVNNPNPQPRVLSGEIISPVEGELLDALDTFERTVRDARSTMAGYAKKAENINKAYKQHCNNELKWAGIIAAFFAIPAAFAVYYQAKNKEKKSKFTLFQN